MKLEKIDLCSITRNPKICKTTINLFDGFESDLWIVLGETSFHHFENKDTYVLKAYLNKGITDFEHDSAYALWLPLVGLTFKHMWYQTSIFVAWIDANSPDDFKVPPSDYNPANLSGAYDCQDKWCRQGSEPHRIVPEGFYTPPLNPDLYHKVAGKKVEIRIGPNFPEDDDVS